ncbi:MAG: hypothetical protein GY816_13555, partial [Cytophagales bacterium]|nr:hypothetical protein [Cytophagales bacterium]
MNIFTAAPHLLSEVYTPWVPDDEIMPLQCVPVPTLKGNVEGKIFKCIIDTGAAPSLVVSESFGREILSRKYRTKAEVDKAIKRTDTSTSISDCQGKEVKIIGQAIVRLKQGSVSCNTPMLLLQGDQKNMEPLIGMYGLKQLGLQLTTIDREELLGQKLTAAQKEGIPIIDAPVEFPKTRHTQINLLKPCFSTKPLQLG